VKLTTKILKQIIKEELSKLSESISPTEIFMDITKRGGADHFLSKAHGRTMKAIDDMHYDQALRQYLYEVRPDDPELPDSVWSAVTNLLKQTVR
jgi:hypothetical protein